MEVSYINSKSFKIVSRFYVIYGDYEPIYVGYTNRTVKQRFKEHEKDKDFSDYENVEVKELIKEKLSFDFTWDYEQTCRNADEVSLREGRLVQQYGTQDSVFQRAIGGGQTWASEKWFVESNKDNPKFVGMSGTEIKIRIKKEKAISLDIHNFVSNMKTQSQVDIYNFVNHMKYQYRADIYGFVNHMKSQYRVDVCSFVSNMNYHCQIDIGSFVNSMDSQYQIDIRNFINNMESRYQIDISNFGNHIKPQYQVDIGVLVNSMKPQYKIDIGSFINTMKPQYQIDISHFVSHMMYQYQADVNNFVVLMNPNYKIDISNFVNNMKWREQ